MTNILLYWASKFGEQKLVRGREKRSKNKKLELIQNQGEEKYRTPFIVKIDKRVVIYKILRLLEIVIKSKNFKILKLIYRNKRKNLSSYSWTFLNFRSLSLLKVVIKSWTHLVDLDINKWIFVYFMRLVGAFE